MKFSSCKEAFFVCWEPDPSCLSYQHGQFHPCGSGGFFLFISLPSGWRKPVHVPLGILILYQSIVKWVAVVVCVLVHGPDALKMMRTICLDILSLVTRC